jgi:hypothetical protein
LCSRFTIAANGLTRLLAASKNAELENIMRQFFWQINRALQQKTDSSSIV